MKLCRRRETAQVMIRPSRFRRPLGTSRRERALQHSIAIVYMTSLFTEIMPTSERHLTLLEFFSHCLEQPLSVGKCGKRGALYPSYGGGNFLVGKGRNLPDLIFLLI